MGYLTLQSGASRCKPLQMVAGGRFELYSAYPILVRAVAARRSEAIITGHGKLLVAIERFAPWTLRAAGRRMAARGGGYRPEAGAR
jgi:hypothetical protein